MEHLHQEGCCSNARQQNLLSEIGDFYGNAHSFFGIPCGTPLLGAPFDPSSAPVSADLPFELSVSLLLWIARLMEMVCMDSKSR